MKLNSRFYAYLGAVALTSGCVNTMDFDLRDTFGSRLDTSEAAQNAVGARPRADSNGIITYPNYQVVVAQRGDTVETVANRIGVNAADLAAYNGRAVTDHMLLGGVLALPNSLRPSSGPAAESADAAAGLVPTVVDISELEPAAVQTTALPQGPEPQRHRVQPGETAFTIARRYNVPAQSIGDWNGLDANLTVTPGQVVIIPIAYEDQGRTAATPLPGDGSLTPTPPSSTRPQPRDMTPTAVATATSTTAVANTGGVTSTSANKTRFVRPVSGQIIRDYKKRKNEGIDIGAPAGTPVHAADGGTVIAITKDTNGIPFIVVKHTKTLITVYSNVSGISVKQGQKVTRGQPIAKVQEGSPSFLHFEVRDGLDSIDPNEFI